MPGQARDAVDHDFLLRLASVLAGHGAINSRKSPYSPRGVLDVLNRAGRKATYTLRVLRKHQVPAATGASTAGASAEVVRTCR